MPSTNCVDQFQYTYLTCIYITSTLWSPYTTTTTTSDFYQSFYELTIIFSLYHRCLCLLKFYCYFQIHKLLSDVCAWLFFVLITTMCLLYVYMFCTIENISILIVFKFFYKAKVTLQHKLLF